MQSQVIWTEDLATSLVKMDLGASSCPSLWVAGISMTSLQVVMVLVQTQVTWTEDLATSLAKMGLRASSCRCLWVAGTNMMSLRMVVGLVVARLLSATAAMDLATLLEIALLWLGFKGLPCHEAEGQFEGRCLTTPPGSSRTRPPWSAIFATRLDTSPETVSEAVVVLRSVA